MNKQAKSIRDAPAGAFRDSAAVFCDLDDTLTTRGKVVESAFCALWDAHHAGLPVVVVTGRPAGWADHISRMWPVHGVIGENGGLYFRHVGGKMERYFAYGAEERAEFRSRLKLIGEEILREVPGSAISADQPFREFDLAVDFSEDVPALSQEEIIRIRDIFLSHGAMAKISSIHVNGWFGEFDKLSAAKLYIERELGLDPEQEKSRIVFIGDSPNDEPMFSFFPNSIGVANIRNFAEFLKIWPAYITVTEGGEGFAEAVRGIIESG